MTARTTYNDGSITYADVTNKTGGGAPGVFFYRTEIDFARLPSTPVADTVDAFHLPANTLVRTAVMEVLTPTTAAATLSLGGAGAADMIAATASDAAAGTQTLGVGSVFVTAGNDVGPKQYTAAQTIKATVGGATIASLGKVRFTLEVVQV